MTNGTPSTGRDSPAADASATGRHHSAPRPCAACFAKLPRVILAASPAFVFTFGLLVTFLGIGVIANILIAYAVIQVLGERQQNEEHRTGTLDV